MNSTRSHTPGNDYLVLEPVDTGGELSTHQVQRICDRHYGLGANGVLALCPSSCPAELGAGTPDSAAVVLW